MSRWKIIPCVAVGLVVSMGAGWAQTVGPETPTTGQGDERQGVAERAHPDYDPLGVRLRSFLVFPSMGVSETYDSNIFATKSGTVSDFYTSLTPTLNVQSDWSRHALGFTAGGEIRRYASHTSENVGNYNASLRGRLDIANGTYAQADASYQLLHEDRSSPDAVNGTHPVEYHVSAANLSFVREPRRIGLRLDTTVASYDYNNATSSTGATIDQNGRDRIEYIVAPRISYEIVPQYQAFLRAVGNERQYMRQHEVANDPTSFKRSSHGYEVDAGTAIDLTHIVNGEVYVGYLEQDYEDSRLSSTTGLGFGANLLWNVTQLTSVRASVSRSVNETTIAGSTGSLATGVRLSLEHELLRNVLLTGGTGWSRDEFQGTTRTDDNYDVTGGVRYLMNRVLSLSADLTYRTRSSNLPVNDYDRIIGMVRLKAAL